MNNVYNISTKKEDQFFPFILKLKSGKEFIFLNHELGESEDLPGFMVIVDKTTDEVEMFFNKDSTEIIEIVKKAESKNDDISKDNS